jgi:hypothetical protein
METLEDFRGYPDLKTLRTLRASVKSAYGLPRAVLLESLDLTTQEIALYEVERVKTLKHLTLRGPIDSLLGLGKLPQLRELVLHSTGSSIHSIKSRSLESLDLTTTPLTMMPWLVTPRLTTLKIRETPLTELFNLEKTKALAKIELAVDRIQTIESTTHAHLQKVGVTIVDGKRRIPYARFAASKQIVEH